MSVVSSVQSRDLRVVRVVFDAAVPQTEPAAAGDALNPAGWAISATVAPGGLVPSVDVEVLSVTSINETTVELTVDTDLSAGRPYQVTVTDIIGLSPSPSTATFTAFTPPQPNTRAFDLASMIPRKNWAEDDTGDLARFIACLQDEGTILLATVDRWIDIINPETAPERFIDSMLVDMGNPFGFGDLSLVDKRRLLLSLTTVYQLKGTVIGIRSAINFFTGLDVDIVIYGGGNAMSVGPTGTSKLGPTGSPAWVLGSVGSACQLEVKVGLPWSATNWQLSVSQLERVTAVIDYMKPANMILVDLIHPRLPVPQWASGLSPTVGYALLQWNQLAGQHGYHVYWRYTPGVSYRNGTLIVTNPGVCIVEWPATSGRNVYCVVMAVDQNGHEGVSSKEILVPVL